ncbi:hypothetical protein Tco_0662006 [Tanacetum coccineum]
MIMMREGQIDKTLFIKRVKGDILLVQVYVDDIICRELKKDDGIFIRQDKYADKIYEKVGFHCKTASTPMETSKPLLKDAEAEDVDVHLYRSMIGSLMYLTASRPDIMFVLYYPKDSPFDLKAYTDSDYAGASLDRKSTTKQVGQFLEGINSSLAMKAKRPTEISQSSGPIPLVENETVIKEWEDIMERVATTASSLEAEQDSVVPKCQDTILGGAEAQIRFEAASKQSNDPPLLRVNTLGSGEDIMKQKELMEFCTKLSERALDLYALTVNPTIYTSCIKQFWATAKVQTVNEEVQIQALVDGKKVIVTETSIRRALHLKDAKGIDCLPAATIFAELTRLGAKTTAWNEFSSTVASAIICLAINQIFNFSKYIFDNMVKNLEGGVKFLMYPRFVQVFLDKQVEDMSKHKEIYVTPSHTKKIFANMKREGKGFSGRITPLFESMMVQAPKEVGDGGPTKPITDEATNEEYVSTPSYDPSQSSEDKMQLNELMGLYTKLSDRVLALENTNNSQAAEIATLKERVKKLEKKRSLGAQEDASKQGRKIADLDADTKVTLIDETQERNDEDLMFDTCVLNGDEVFQEPIVNTTTTTSLISVSDADPVTTAGEVVTTASIEIPEELTLSQTLIEIKSAKPKDVTTAATTVTPASSRPKVKGIIFHDQEEQEPASTPIVSPSQLPQAKDKGKTKMVEPEKPLKKKDQIAIDEEVAKNLEAQLQA